MKLNLLIALALMMLITTLSSCSAIEGIFKAGMGVGIFMVVIIIIVIIVIMARLRKK